MTDQLRVFGITRLHGLVNNAGNGLDASETTSEEVFDQLVNIHFNAGLGDVA